MGSTVRPSATPFLIIAASLSTSISLLPRVPFRNGRTPCFCRTLQSVRKPDFGAKSGCCSQQSPCTLPVMAGMMKKTVEWWVLFVKSANKASLQVSAKMILGKQCWICSQSFVSSVFTKQRDCFRSFSSTSSSTKKLMDRTFLPMVLFLGELSEIGDPQHVGRSPVDT